MRPGRPNCSRSWRKLALLQIDPTAAIAPSADLVAWSRLGSAYEPAHLKQAVWEDRALFEHDAMVRPMSDLGLYLAGAADWPSYERTRAWMHENDRFRRDILDLLGDSGPLSSRDIPDTAVVPWASTGWTNNRNVTQRTNAPKSMPKEKVAASRDFEDESHGTRLRDPRRDRPSGRNDAQRRRAAHVPAARPASRRGPGTGIPRGEGLRRR